MRRVVAVSSFVAHGSVGLRAPLSVFSAAGVDVIAVPTIVLSGHLGHAHTAGQAIAAADVDAMIAALERKGALAGVDAVVTGYLPTAAHVAAARRAIDAVRRLNPEAIVLVDPIMGDDPGGLYVDGAVAHAISTELAPVSDILTPNRFELARITGRTVTDIESAGSAMATLRVPMIAATSIPDGTNTLATMLRHAGSSEVVRTQRRATAPHGTGDLFAALFLLGILNKRSPREALAVAVDGVARAIDASGEALDLALERIDWRAIHA